MTHHKCTKLLEGDWTEWAIRKGALALFLLVNKFGMNRLFAMPGRVLQRRHSFNAEELIITSLKQYKVLRKIKCYENIKLA